ncbi:MAG: hypothetical protein WCA35_05250 [Kovacikia sp.]
MAILSGGVSPNLYWFTDLELPFAAQAMTAAELSLDAASQADITRGEIGRAMAALAKEGGRMTPVVIAVFC